MDRVNQGTLPAFETGLRESIMKNKPTIQHPSDTVKVAFGKSSCQNTAKEKGHDKGGSKKVKTESDKVAGKPRGYKLPAEGISGEGAWVGGGFHGVREGTGRYKPSEGASQEGEDSTKPVDSTRYFETTKGVKTYSEVYEDLAVAVARKIEEIIASDPDEIDITSEWICKIHKDIAGPLFQDWAGRFRDVNVQVGPHAPPPYYEVPVFVRLYCDDMKIKLSHAEKDVKEIAELLAWADWRFQWIHPFKDFNGRIGRILLSAILFKLKLPPAKTISVDPSERKRYLNALRSADSGDIWQLAQIWMERLLEAVKGK